MNYELKNINIDIPDPVQEILDTLIDAGYEAYIVGGCVRDCILGRKPEDWDITTQALPFQVKSLFGATVDTGLEHGTVMVIKQGAGYEVTTFRLDGKYLDGRHPESVEFTPSLEEDLKRRDLTINAFAYSDERGVIDLFGGEDDLSRGLIRCVGDPERRFKEDALRMMRAVRFAAQLGFEIEEKTAVAIKRCSGDLAKVSTERIRVEFEKTLLSDNPGMLKSFEDFGLAEHIFPGVYEKCFKEEEINVVCRISDEREDDLKFLRLASFFGRLSYEECRKTLKSFTYDNRTRECVSCIIKSAGENTQENAPAVKRAMKRSGSEIFILAQKLCGERALARGEDAAHYMCLEEIAKEIVTSKEPYMLSQLAVNGSDLIDAGVLPGRRVGECLEMLLERVIDEPALNNRDSLLKLI